MEQYLKYILTAYLIIINIISFALMGVDKNRARKKGWRISEAALFATAILFGALGSTIGMHFFKHKTRHWYFVLGMPFILVVQVVALAFIINRF